jgi:hypothetical protein
MGFTYDETDPVCIKDFDAIMKSFPIDVFNEEEITNAGLETPWLLRHTGSDIMNMLGEANPSTKADVELVQKRFYEKFMVDFEHSEKQKGQIAMHPDEGGSNTRMSCLADWVVPADFPDEWNIKFLTAVKTYLNHVADEERLLLLYCFSKALGY